MFMVMQNIYEGLFWFLIPVCLVICNDIMAYVFGKQVKKLLAIFLKIYSSLSSLQDFSLAVQNLSTSHRKRHGKDSLGLSSQPSYLDLL